MWRLVFYGRPSTYLWEDEEGTVHTIIQGEGGEQSDALMPLLFSLANIQDWRPFTGSCE